MNSRCCVFSIPNLSFDELQTFNVTHSLLFCCRISLGVFQSIVFFISSVFSLDESVEMAARRQRQIKKFFDQTLITRLIGLMEWPCETESLSLLSSESRKIIWTWTKEHHKPSFSGGRRRLDVCGRFSGCGKEVFRSETVAEVVRNSSRIWLDWIFLNYMLTNSDLFCDSARWFR